MFVKRFVVFITLVAVLLGIAATWQVATANDVPPDPNVLVKKDARTTFNRVWKWSIDKTGNVSSLTLTQGQIFNVQYRVDLVAVPQDSDHTVSGQIVIQNRTALPLEVTSITDLISPDIAVDHITCPHILPYTIPAGSSMQCFYDKSLPDGAARINTVTVIGNGATYTAHANVLFGAPANELDKCVDVVDDKLGALGTVCITDLPKTFTYSLPVGPFETCGAYQFTNEASFITKDTGATGSDTWVVDINVPCDGGCTLTPGYWKTHSSYGPAPYDDTWAQIGENTPFFLSGKSYYDVLWTAPRGNAYYILAHAYIAAQLNQLNDAAIPANVLTAFNTATGLFGMYTPAQIAALRSNSSLRAQFIALASMLDDYNNGLLGPGHCSEDSTTRTLSSALVDSKVVFLPSLAR